LFICGVCHVESFLSLVRGEGLKANVIHKDWERERKLDDIVSEGVIRDINEAELSNELSRFIGDNADALNSNYPYLFGEIQRMMTGWIILALARVFEEKNPRLPFDLRSIPEALKVLEASNIHIKDRAKLIDAIAVTDSERQRLQRRHDEELLRDICDHFRERQKQLKAPIKRIIEKRNKGFGVKS
jgi:hypothetical protein